MSDWLYTNIERVKQIPPCPDCKSAIGVDCIDGGSRYHCNNCLTKFTAMQTSRPHPRPGAAS